MAIINGKEMTIEEVINTYYPEVLAYRFWYKEDLDDLVERLFDEYEESDDKK